tara:strand:- start:9950 stop:10192 length:243 start_codon:yes stop_codon:yes gene_type:complete
MARQRMPPKPKAKKRKKAEVKEKSRKVYFSGGERDGDETWLVTPLPKSLKWNLGRDNYFQSESDPSIYEYDPLREIVYEN